MKQIVELEVFCRCGKCDEAVRDILRMEEMLCRGAKSVLGMRRKRIQKAKRSEFDRHRYAERVGR